MVLTFSAVFLFGIALAFLLRSRALGFGSAVIAVGFGFFLASTGAATPIHHLAASLAAALTHLGT